MNYGLALLPELPLSLRLLREIHNKLMQGVRGGEKTPGEFRKSQNWIGGQGITLDTASFVPPPPVEMMQSLDNLEKFLHTRRKMPILIQCGLAHAQFETIHPFLDGNGRVGRLLITFMLCAAKVLSQPLLYLSYYLKQHRQEYYDRLTAVRIEGDWEGWLKFFLCGVAEVSEYATLTARKILALRENHRQKFCDSALLMRFLDHLFKHPLTNIKFASEALGVTYMTARTAIEKLLEAGVLIEITGFQRNKIYSYQQYIHLFSEQTLPSN
jgi:Fic family protein